MSQLDEIRTVQDNLEDIFSKRMAELEALIKTGIPAKDTVARVAEEFRAFKELMFSMLTLLRKQVNDCCQMVDTIETRHRGKALIFFGIAESDKENCATTILGLLTRMELREFSSSSFTACHRIGVANKDHHRPILVRFSSAAARSAVWRAKTKLKGTSASVREFLTKTRQAVFSKARQHFGMRPCWTQDGVVIVKTADGNRHKVTTVCELNALTKKYAKATGDSAASKTAAGLTGITAKQRR